jgi:AbrB family looped-hinge helix DNA binding protein
MRETIEATVTSKGQVTIPKEIRDKLGIEAGSDLEFRVEDDGSLTVREKKSGPERLRELRDRLPDHDVDLDEMRRESKRAWSSQTTEGTE